MTLDEAITAALEAREAEMKRCPFHPEHRGTPPSRSGQCPECGSLYSGPCWVNVGANAAFVDAIKEIVA